MGGDLTQFATPETWIKDEKGCAVLRSDYYRSATLFIVADEAHCIPQWSVFTIIWVKLLEQQKFSYDQFGNSAIKRGGVHKNLHKENQIMVLK